MPDNPEQPGRQSMKEFVIKWKDLRKHAENPSRKGGGRMLCESSRPISFLGALAKLGDLNLKSR